jgi:hypothetical protein
LATAWALSGDGHNRTEAGSAVQITEQRLPPELSGPCHDNQRRLQVVHPARKKAQEPQRWVIRPLRVVDQHHDRPVGRDVRKQPIQPMKMSEHALAVA